MLLCRPVDGVDGVLEGGVGKVNKGERQQMLNKAAQQRYRERKKAKANQLVHAVAVLQEKVDELNIIEAEKRVLKVSASVRDIQ